MMWKALTHRSIIAPQTVRLTRPTSRSTWAIGVSGKMPWPRLKIKGAAAEPFQDFARPRNRARRRPASSARGSRLPCTGAQRLDRIGGKGQVDRRVEADHVSAACARDFNQMRSSPSRKQDDWNVRPAGLHPRDDSAQGFEAPALKFALRKHPRPRNRRSGPHRRPHRFAARDRRSRLRQAGRSAQRKDRGPDRPADAPAPGRASPGRRPYNSPPSTARRRTPATPTSIGRLALTCWIASNTGDR